MLARCAAILFCAALFVAPSTLLGAGTSAQTRTLNVLFIGNSYTFFNNLGDLVAGIAAGLPGPKIAPALAVQGGMPLGWHLVNGPAMQMLDEKTWDHVVMQDHSLFGGLVINGDPRMAPAKGFHESARILVQRVRARNARPLFFMTWARRGRPAEEPILTNAYLDIGRELGVDVAPVGIAWTEALKQDLPVDLFSADGAHPSPAGSYLAACVIYASLTGHNPQGAPLTIEGSPWSRTDGIVDTTQRVPLVTLDRAVAEQLQELAWQTVRDR
jgi:hypothetical protein